VEERGQEESAKALGISRRTLCRFLAGQFGQAIAPATLERLQKHLPAEAIEQALTPPGIEQAWLDAHRHWLVLQLQPFGFARYARGGSPARDSVATRHRRRLTWDHLRRLYRWHFNRMSEFERRLVALGAGDRAAYQQVRERDGQADARAALRVLHPRGLLALARLVEPFQPERASPLMLPLGKDVPWRGRPLTDYLHHAIGRELALLRVAPPRDVAAWMANPAHWTPITLREFARRC
jgi:hypothetical protein